MSTTQKDPREVLDLTVKHAEFDLHPGLGNNQHWHGTTYNMKKLQRATAEQMAKDPTSPWIRFSATRIAEDAAAAQTAAAAAPTQEKAAGKAAAAK
ncbi:MAG TPA: hypothetical protein PLB89_04765 [Flavobacteriales bacterium]|nr:hypothetical protein [Flavobacteriales bacterium]